MIAAGEFVEWAYVFGYRYGSPKEPMKAALEAGRDILFDIDWQGTHSSGRFGNDLVSIFVLPPSMDELERRLHNRGTNSEEVIESRMHRAADEIDHWAEYEYVLVNQDMDVCLSEVRSIVDGRTSAPRSATLPLRLCPTPVERPQQLSVEKLEEPRRSKEVATSFSSAVSASASEPHCSSCQRSSMLTASQACSARSPFEHGQARQQRSADRHQRRQTRKPEGVERGDGVRKLLHRRRRLRDVHQPGRGREIHVVTPPRPAEQRVPAPLLPFDQSAWPFRAVAGEIGLRVSREAIRELAPRRRDPVDGGIRQPRQWHRARIDLLPDRAPLVGNRLSKGGRRRLKRGARWRLHRAPIQPDSPAVLFGLDCHFLPEPLHGRSCRSFSSHAFFSRIGAKRASITPMMQTTAPTCGQPPSRNRSE